MMNLIAKTISKFINVIFVYKLLRECSQFYFCINEIMYDKVKKFFRKGWLKFELYWLEKYLTMMTILTVIDVVLLIYTGPKLYKKFIKQTNDVNDNINKGLSFGDIFMTFISMLMLGYTVYKVYGIVQKFTNRKENLSGADKKIAEIKQELAEL